MASGVKDKRRLGQMGGAVLGFSDESRVESLKSKVIVYPNFIFSITIECDRSLDCYIVVKTKILHEVVRIGYTETRKYLSETSMCFSTTFEVSYQVGIDDDQLVLFDIFDGDVLSLREGYLFSSLSVPLSSLSKSKVAIPISRGPSILGYLRLNADLDVSPTNCTLDLTNDYHTAFFKVPRLSIEDIKNAFPEMVDISLKYNLRFKTSAVYKILKKFKIDVKKNEYLRTLMRICVCESGDSPDSEDLRVVWESNPVTKAPYELHRKELQLRHDSFLCDIKTTLGRDVVFQIYVDGHDVKVNKPMLLLWTQMPMNEVMGSKHTDDKKKTKTDKKVLHFQSNVEALRPVGKKNSSSLLKKLDFLHHNDNDNDSLDDEFDEGNGPDNNASGNDDDDDDDDADDNDSGNEDDTNPLNMMNHALKRAQGEIDKVSMFSHGGNEDVKPKMEKKSVFGTMNIKIEQSEEKTNLENGDASYEEKIRVIYEKRSQEWTENVRAQFNESVEEQTENALYSTENLECRIDGVGLALTILADIYTPALVDLLTKLQLPTDDPLHRSLNATFFGSTVLESIEDITHKFNPFLEDEKIEIYAMGAVSAPSRGDGSPHEYAERTTSFPLGQELLLSALYDRTLHSVKNKMASSRIMSRVDTLFSATKDAEFRRYIDPLAPPLPSKKENKVTIQNAPRRLLEDFLRTGNLTEGDESAYVRETLYSSLESIRNGFTEATGCYCPAISIDHQTSSTDGLLVDANEQERKKRAYREKQYKYRLHACYTGTFVDSSSILFSDDTTKVLTNARNKVENFDFFVPNLRTAVNFDADVLDLLLFDSSSDVAPLSKLIVWVIGKCPSQKILERLETAIQRILLGETTRPLLIYLACEPILDVTSKNLEHILSTQFTPIFDAFDKAVEDAKLLAKDLHIDKKQLLTPNKYHCKKSLYRSLGNMLTIYHNISFSEVLATAFIRDDDQNTVERSRSASNDGEEIPEDDFANLPRYTILRETLSLYFDTKTTSNIIGKVTLSSQETDVTNKRHSILGEELSSLPKRSSFHAGDSRRTSLVRSSLSSNIATITSLAKRTLRHPSAVEETEEERNAKEEALRIKKHEEDFMAARVPDINEIQKLHRAFKKFQNIGNSAFMKAFSASVLKDLNSHLPRVADLPTKQRTCQPPSIKGGCIIS